MKRNNFFWLLLLSSELFTAVPSPFSEPEGGYQNIKSPLAAGKNQEQEDKQFGMWQRYFNDINREDFKDGDAYLEALAQRIEKLKAQGIVRNAQSVATSKIVTYVATSLLFCYLGFAFYCL